MLKEKVKNLKSLIGKTEPQNRILLEISDILDDIVDNLTQSEITSVINKNESILDFIKRKKLTSHSDIVLGIAYYLEKYKDAPVFNINDIKEMYDEARQKPPRNFSDVAGKLEREKDYFIKHKDGKDGLKAWKISADGLEYIESMGEE